MILQLRKIALVEDTSTDVAVILSNINDGVDGSAVFGLSAEIEEIKIESGDTYIPSSVKTLDVRVLKPSSSDVTQIQSWASNQTELYVVGLGLDGCFFFGDLSTQTGLVTISSAEFLNGNDVFSFKLTVKTELGFNSSTGLHEGGFWSGENLLGGMVWGDADADGVANGWVASGFTSTSFASDVQTIENDTTERVFKRDIYFPFVGEEITFSATYGTITGSAVKNEIGITFLSSTGSFVSATNQTVSASQINSSNTTVPSNTFKVSCRIVMDASSGTLTNEVSYPTLRLGSGTTYTKF